MPSWRAFRKLAYQSVLYEAQDVLMESDDVDLVCVEPEPGFHWNKCMLPIAKEIWKRRSLWNDFTRGVIYLNPGLKPLRLKKEYDLLVVVCQNWWEVLFVNAIKGWKDHCRTSVCWLDELWIDWIAQNRWWLSALNQFDHVAVGLHGSADAVSEVLGRPCHWVPSGVDAIRFAPYPPTTTRSVDVYSLGRRNERLHQALLSLVRQKQIFYIYDGCQVSEAVLPDHKQHRDLIAGIAKRSRFFLVGPAKMGVPQETKGQLDIGSRFFEGAAAGAVLIGQKPDCESFRQLFDWPNSVIEVEADGSNAGDLLSNLSGQPELLREIGRRNTVEALRRHDWVYRWKSILEIAGVKPAPAMIAREQQLRRMAEGVESSDDLVESMFPPMGNLR